MFAPLFWISGGSNEPRTTTWVNQHELHIGMISKMNPEIDNGNVQMFSNLFNGASTDVTPSAVDCAAEPTKMTDASKSEVDSEDEVAVEAAEQEATVDVEKSVEAAEVDAVEVEAAEVDGVDVEASVVHPVEPDAVMTAVEEPLQAGEPSEVAIVEAVEPTATKEESVGAVEHDDHLKADVEALENKVATLERLTLDVNSIRDSARAALEAVETASTKLVDRSAALDDVPSKKEIAKLAVDSSLAFVNELKLDMRAFLDERVATSIEAAVEKHAARVTQARIDDLIQRTLVQSHAMTISAAVKEGMKGEYMTEEKLKGMFSEISENTPPLR